MDHIPVRVMVDTMGMVSRAMISMNALTRMHVPQEPFVPILLVHSLVRVLQDSNLVTLGVKISTNATAVLAVHKQLAPIQTDRSNAPVTSVTLGTASHVQISTNVQKVLQTVPTKLTVTILMAITTVCAEQDILEMDLVAMTSTSVHPALAVLFHHAIILMDHSRARVTLATLEMDLIAKLYLPNRQQSHQLNRQQSHQLNRQLSHQLNRQLSHQLNRQLSHQLSRQLSHQLNRQQSHQQSHQLSRQQSHQLN